VFGVYAVGSTVYAATNGGVSISTDGGNTFTNSTNGLGGTSGINSGSSVNVVYADGGKIYAATQNGLAISSNGGTSFTNITTANSVG